MAIAREEIVGLGFHTALWACHVTRSCTIGPLGRPTTAAADCRAALACVPCVWFHAPNTSIVAPGVEFHVAVICQFHPGKSGSASFTRGRRNLAPFRMCVICLISLQLHHTRRDFSYCCPRILTPLWNSDLTPNVEIADEGKPSKNMSAKRTPMRSSKVASWRIFLPFLRSFLFAISAVQIN